MSSKSPISDKNETTFVSCQKKRGCCTVVNMPISQLFSDVFLNSKLANNNNNNKITLPQSDMG